MHKYKLRQVPRFFGTNWCAIVVPIQVIRWYRQCYDGTDSCAIVVQIRRYCHYRLSCLQRCISFESYIKPQPLARFKYFSHVVYLLNPTSNHNLARSCRKSNVLYIFWILHQTTTACRVAYSTQRCISFESYIKPQPDSGTLHLRKVVYLLNPTSNHNLATSCRKSNVLYIFWILHQTTTSGSSGHKRERLYIFWILHQTTTRVSRQYRRPWLYIFWILHQTTTLRA